MSHGSKFSPFVQSSPSRRRVVCVSAALLASATVLTPSFASAQAAKGPAFHATVRTGTHPISGAVVALLGNGSGGYGSGPSLLELGYTDSNGNVRFSGNYTCPAAPKDQVYLVAAEGNPGAGYNYNLSLMAGLGSCKALNSSTSVVVNEVTTIASVYALSPFMAKVVNVGTSSTNYQGLLNAFNTIGNLENATTGQALTITPAYAPNPVASLHTSTVPQARINTLANILASCIETNGLGGSSTACSNLFGATAVTGSSQPQTTLQAVENIAQHPGTNVPAIFALAAANGPYQPSLTIAPNDLQLAISYTGAGLGLVPQGTVGDIQNTAIALDATGNVLVTGYGERSGSVAANSSMLAKFSNLGAPLTPDTTQPTPDTVNYGGLLTSALGVPEPIGLAIDQTGDAWISGTSSFINAIRPSLTPLFGQGIPTGALGTIEYFAFDKSGTVYTAGNPGSGSLGKFSKMGAQISPQGGYTGGGAYGDGYYGTLYQPTFDSTGANLWASDAQFGDLYRINPTTGQLVYDYFPTGGQVTALVAGRSGNIYACPQGPSSLEVFNASSTSAVATYPISTGRGCGNRLIADGNSNIFVIGSTIDEFTSTGTQVSPAAGYTATSAQEALTVHGAISGAVDTSGNLWILNVSTGKFETDPGNVLVEFVGAAAPAVTPLATALTQGKIAQLP